VVVKFLPPAARFVQESRWHASQVLTQERDGSLLARFTLSTTVEIKSWVLGFGANAVVIEPEELRRDHARIGANDPGLSRSADQQQVGNDQ
jgi:hypothetical protein